MPRSATSTRCAKHSATAWSRSKPGAAMTGCSSGQADPRGDGRRRSGDLPGDVPAGRLARPRRLPRTRRAPLAARRLELRGPRHEARALGQALLRHPALRLLGVRRKHQGRRATRLHILLGTGERRTYRLRLRRLLPPDAAALPGRARERPRHDLPRPGPPLRAVPLVGCLRRPPGRRRPPQPRRAHGEAADRQAPGGRRLDRRPARLLACRRPPGWHRRGDLRAVAPREPRATSPSWPVASTRRCASAGREDRGPPAHCAGLCRPRV